MHIRFAETAIAQLQSIKSYIARDNPQGALKHIKKIIAGTKKMLSSPYIGKVNAVYNREDIRETVIEGYKTIHLFLKPLEKISENLSEKNIFFTGT